MTLCVHTSMRLLWCEFLYQGMLDDYGCIRGWGQISGVQTILLLPSYNGKLSPGIHQARVYDMHNLYSDNMIHGKLILITVCPYMCITMITNNLSG